MKQPMEKALYVAEENLKQIRTVAEWGKEMGYESPKKFSRKFRNHFGKRPKSTLIELKLNCFFKLIEDFREISCYEIAVELGLKDEIALNKFINRHTGRSPNQWKNMQVKNGN